MGGSARDATATTGRACTRGSRRGAREQRPPGFKQVTVALEESPVLFQRLLDDTVCARLAQRGFLEKGAWLVKYEKPGLIANVPSIAVPNIQQRHRGPPTIRGEAPAFRLGSDSDARLRASKELSISRGSIRRPA